MNIFKILKGKRAVRILKKSKTLPKNSRALYRDIKKAGLK